MATNSTTLVAPSPAHEEIQHLVSANNYYWSQGLPCFPKEACPDSQQRLRNYQEIQQQLHTKLKEVKYFFCYGRYYVKCIGQWPLEPGQTHPSCFILEVVVPHGLCSRLKTPLLTFTALTDSALNTLAKAEPVTEACYHKALNRVLVKGRFDYYTLVPGLY